MDIIYAKFVPTPAFVRKENNSEFHINQHQARIIEVYNLTESRATDIANEDEVLYQKLKTSFETKKCIACGGNIRYVHSYDFWGCANYRTEIPYKRHTTFSGKEPFISVRRVDIDRHWIANIIKECDLKGKVTVKKLHEFFVKNKIPDLRMKYGLSGGEDLFMGLVKASKRSKEQELECLEYIQQFQTKVVYQQCIEYQLKDKKPTICIPDFIAGDDKFVTVIDAKLDYVNDAKMDLYVALVEFIIRLKGDKRKVVGSHIMYYDDVNQFMNSKYPVITI